MSIADPSEGWRSLGKGVPGAGAAAGGHVTHRLFGGKAQELSASLLEPTEGFFGGVCGKFPDSEEKPQGPGPIAWKTSSKCSLTRT